MTKLLSINMKKKKRDSFTRTLMMVGGIFFFLLTIAFIIFCIPFMLILIGFIMLPAGAIPLFIGFSLMNTAEYESEEVVCPYCKNTSTQNFGVIKKHNAFDCKSCKKRILIK